MAYRENAKILKADCLADGVYEIWFETKNIAKAAKACLLYTSPSPRD